MKKYTLLAAIALVAVSCNKPGPTPLQPTLSAEPNSLEFANVSAPAQTITVTAAETEWDHRLSDTSGWITVEREGSLLSVSVTDNETQDIRTATVTISATVSGVAPVKVTVKQEASKVIHEEPSISATPQTLTFVAENAPEQEVEVKVTGGITWKASPSGAEDWIHITALEGRFNVKVDDNPQSLQRSAAINVSPSDKTIPAVRVHIIQEPLAVEPSIVPILPNDATPEEGVLLPYTNGTVIFPLTVEPKDSQWTVEVEGENTSWFTLLPIVAPEKHQIFVEYKINESKEVRTAYIVISHPDPKCEPVRVKLTQNSKPDMESTILQDVNCETFTQNRVEVQANNDFRDWPYSHWTFTLYTEGINYNNGRGTWSGSGERIRILLTASPQNENDVTMEEGTYQVVSYDEYNVLAAERKPGWACGSKGSGTNLYPSGIWYQVLEDGNVTDRANAVSGTVTISKTGDDYTISWDLVSDAGFKVAGSYSGPFNIM